MKPCSELRGDIVSGRFDNTFLCLYPRSSAESCRRRYISLLEGFMESYGDMPAILLSAPGRTEIGGNHTDHQHGNVLAAAVNLDIICVAAPNGSDLIRVGSAQYPANNIDISDLSVVPCEKETSAALIRGVAAWFANNGTTLGGFNAYTSTDVLRGSGLSSSAAFEVVIGTAMSLLFDPSKTSVDIALAGKYAENNYFGKPSGLMDQMACSVGGFVQIDFKNPDSPVIRPVRRDLSEYGYHLCIVDTKGSHADLTDDYAAITTEMHSVARHFGKDFLREVEEEEFYRDLSSLRHCVGDRAVLRAIHYFNDNRLAVDSAKALESGDIHRFLQNIKTSGRSSFCCLQNVFSVKNPDSQGLSLALAISEKVLGKSGGWRVHGGGFAGTIQAFVPDNLLTRFVDAQNALFGPGSCYVLTIRQQGGCAVEPT